MAGSKKNTSSGSQSNQVTEKSSKTETKNVKKASKKEPEPVVEEVEEVEQQETQVAESESKFETLFKGLQAELKEIRDRQSGVALSLKKLESAHRAEIKAVRKHKQKRNGTHKPTGFAKPQVVPEKLAKFIGVPKNQELTGPEITSAVWAQMKKRNLTYEKDKRVFRTNPEVTKLFGVTASVNESTDHKDKNGFNFCNLQTYIAKALKA